MTLQIPSVFNSRLKIFTCYIVFLGRTLKTRFKEVSEEIGACEVHLLLFDQRFY